MTTSLSFFFEYFNTITPKFLHHKKLNKFCKRQYRISFIAFNCFSQVKYTPNEVTIVETTISHECLSNAQVMTNFYISPPLLSQTLRSDGNELFICLRGHEKKGWNYLYLSISIFIDYRVWSMCSYSIVIWNCSMTVFICIEVVIGIISLVLLLSRE